MVLTGPLDFRYVFGIGLGISWVVSVFSWFSPMILLWCSWDVLGGVFCLFLDCCLGVLGSVFLAMLFGFAWHIIGMSSTLLAAFLNAFVNIIMIALGCLEIFLGLLGMILGFSWNVLRLFFPLSLGWFGDSLKVLFLFVGGILGVFLECACSLAQPCLSYCKQSLLLQTVFLAMLPR